MRWGSECSIIFFADRAPSTLEDEEEDVTLEDAVARPTEPSYEDRMEDHSKPKRKWKRKVYPASAVRRSARIRTAKKFHDEL